MAKSAKSITERTNFGRSRSSETRVGDALVTAGVGVATALWTATRPTGSRFFWSLGLVGLGAISMVESQPGTALESGGAGMLGAASGVGILEVLNLVQ